MKYSLMTTPMIFGLMGKLKVGVPMDQIQTEYQDILQKVAELGIAAVEVTSLELNLFGRTAVQRALKEAGLEVGGLLHMEQYASVNREDYLGIVERTKEKILDAAALGSNHIMLALMAQPDVSEYSFEQLKESLIHNIAPIAEFGNAHGVKVSVEDTPEIRLPLCDSRDTASLLEAVPELYLTYDTGNMLLKGDDSLSYYKQFKKRVWHVHLKDMDYAEEGDLTPDGRRMKSVLHGTGLIDFKPIMDCLRADGYANYLVIELLTTGDFFAQVKQAKSYLDSL